MIIFTSLLLKLFPLYMIILLGYIAGRFFETSEKTSANLLINIIIPVITFGYIAEIPFKMSTIAIPITICLVSLFLGISFNYLSKSLSKDSTANLVALSASTGNFGYFGIPLFILIFGRNGLGIYMLAIAGFTFYMLTIGYYIIARGKYDIKSSIYRVIKLPPIYAAIAGLIVSVFDWSLPQMFMTTIENFRGAYVVLGSMMVGLGISHLKMDSIDFKYLAITFIGKFIIYPFFVFLIIKTDQLILHLFEETFYQVLFVFSVVPLMVNVVIYAKHVDVQSEKAAAGVFISTIFALIYIPIIYILYQIVI
jgi:predicted permease